MTRKLCACNSGRPCVIHNVIVPAGKFPPPTGNENTSDDVIDKSKAAEIVESMQNPSFRKAGDRFFAMTPAELGEAAVEGARARREEGLPPS